MQSIADGLPPEISRHIHPKWRKNELDYWANRDSWLVQYENLWVAFAEVAVIASGPSHVEIFHDANESGQHSFVACVSHEHEPARIRRTTFN
jgi:hypothetical protein